MTFFCIYCDSHHKAGECYVPDIMATVNRLTEELAETRKEFINALGRELANTSTEWRFEHWCGDGWSWPTPSDCREYVRKAIDAAREQEP